ncbi:MAG: hypothetical protein KGM24_09870, partial [Elusimicrobia bacterium]|nr:hypothetical protein [Elusimicrobiota bacterium]
MKNAASLSLRALLAAAVVLVPALSSAQVLDVAATEGSAAGAPLQRAAGVRPSVAAPLSLSVPTLGAAPS